MDSEISRLIGGDETAEAGSDLGNSISIHVRVAGKDHKLQVVDDTTPHGLREQLLAGPLADSAGKRFRFISGGRVVPDDSTLRESGVKDGGHLHCIVTDQPAPSAPPGDAPDVAEEDVASRGFGHLRRMGFTDDEIQALRLHFRDELRQVDEAAPEVEGESAQARIVRLEEEWMRVQPPHSEFSVNVAARLGASSVGLPDSASDGIDRDLEAARRALYRDSEVEEGTTSDFVWGFVLGFFLGFLMLFWVWHGRVRRKQKLGILAGVTVSLVFSIMRQQDAAANNAGRSAAAGGSKATTSALRGATTELGDSQVGGSGNLEATVLWP